APAPVPPDDGGDRLREEHDDHPPAAHRAHPPADRHGETRRWLAGAAAARQRHQDRLIAHLPLDAGTALVELLPLPLILLANAAVGKTWAAVATPALAAIPAVMTGLVGVLDLLGAPTGATGLSRQAALAVAGVGVGLAYFKRRTVPEAMTRLGLVRPAWWHLALALAAAGALFALGQESDVLNHAWSPDLARRVDATTQHIFGQLGTQYGIA